MTQNQIDDSYDSDKYSLMLSYVYDTLLSSGEYLSESAGREWYRLPNYRIGIMPYDKAKRGNQFNVLIQYEQHHMFGLESNLKGLDLPFGGTFEQYHISRIDVSRIVKTPHDYLTNHDFISPYRVFDRKGSDGRTETVYLGHRKNGNVMRMYNKTIELKADNAKHPINYKKIELFSKYFGDIEDLYTFELELHRKYIKPTFGIDTLSDLDRVYKAHADIAGKIRIYEDNDYNRKLIAQNNRDRVESLYLVEYKELERLEKKKYKTSESYMIDKAVSAFERYEKSLEEPLKEHQKLFVVDKIISRIFEDKDISIELEDSEHVKEYNRMMSKIELLSDGQDDQLSSEANIAFAPIMLQTAKDLF